MKTQNPRIGHGYDLHRLEFQHPEGPGRPFILAGVTLDHEKGPVSHSDGDAVFHAVTDALLGALGEEDIGQIFPDDAPEWDGQDSTIFLKEAAKRVADAGYQIGNLDVTIICQKPKIGPYKSAMKENLARTLQSSNDRVNIKAKTHEEVDAVGEGRAVEVHAVVLIFSS
jgi:2-C-methyl-D-erythritol 2,4-cyclodiphosphate synthase